jgi:arylsulfatase A-like enzyme
MQIRVFLAFVMGIGILGCGKGPVEVPSSAEVLDRPDILLVTYCTMRADRWGVYGGGQLTPNIDALAHEAVVFRNHYTQASYSGGSFASIITGKYGFHHGIYDHPRRLEDHHVTLAELFKEAGYATGAFVTHGYISPKWNYPQGIDRFNSFDLDEVSWSRLPDIQKTYRRLGEALEWVDEIGERPYFLWFQTKLTHYFPRTHQRFVSPDEYNVSREFKARTKELPVSRIMFDFDSLNVTEDEAESLLALYDGAIAETDEMLGMLLQGLRDRGRLENTIVVITADHGETLGEAGLFFNHDSNLYEPTVHIPLLLRIPGHEPGEVLGLTRNIDLLPTLTELVGIEAPDDIDGRSLLGLMAGEESDLPVFSETRPKAAEREDYERYPVKVAGVEGKVRMIRHGNHKLILTPVPDGYELQLYDLEVDPGETTNLSRSQPDLARRLGWELEQWFSGYQEADTSPLELDEEDMESLRALGYLD